MTGVRAGPHRSAGIAAVEESVGTKLPSGFVFEWTEIALREPLSGSTAAAAFVIVVVFVFLLVSALYEIGLLPLSVIMIVPLFILAAMIGVTIRGLSRDILVDVGLVVLAGQAAKTREGRCANPRDSRVLRHDWRDGVRSALQACVRPSRQPAQAAHDGRPG